MNISYVLQVLIALLFFCIGICVGQVSVIHFNSEWNSNNNFDITVLKDCDVDSVIICDNPELQEKHKIKSVPTIIVFDEGIEVVRFEANIMMQLVATQKKVQKSIDEITFNKFQ